MPGFQLKLITQHVMTKQLCVYTQKPPFMYVNR